MATKKYNQFSFIKPVFLKKDFCGKELHFYSIPVSITPLLKDITIDLARNIAVLTGDTLLDSSSRVTKHINPDASGYEERIDEAIDPTIAAMRSKERAESFASAVNAIFSDKNAELIAMIIMGSLREDFPPTSEDNPDPKEFFTVFGAELDHAKIATLLRASFEASAEALSPFFSLLWDYLNGKLSGVLSKVSPELQSEVAKVVAGPTPPKKRKKS